MSMWRRSHLPARQYDVVGDAVAVAGTLYEALTPPLGPGSLITVDVRLKSTSPALVGVMSARLFIRQGSMTVFLTDIATLSANEGICWQTGTPYPLMGSERIGVSYTSDQIESAPEIAIGVLS